MKKRGCTQNTLKNNKNRNKKQKNAISSLDWSKKYRKKKKTEKQRRIYVTSKNFKKGFECMLKG